MLEESNICCGDYCASFRSQHHNIHHSPPFDLCTEKEFQCYTYFIFFRMLLLDSLDVEIFVVFLEAV